MEEKKKEKEIVFSRPPFAREVFTEEANKKFDELPGWQRHLIKQILKHGNLKLAAREAGVSTYTNKEIDQTKAENKTVQDALLENGVDSTFIVTHLKDCLEANTIKFDKFGNPQPMVDLKLKLETIKTILQVWGAFDGKKQISSVSPMDLFEDTKLDE